MFLPIGDEPNLDGRPIVTHILIAINVAIFVLISWPLTQQAVDLADPAVADYLRKVSQEVGASSRELLNHLNAYDLFIFKHGFKPADPSWVTLFTSMFLHAGWLHLIGNMLFLWIFGDNVELHVGRLGFVALYLLTGMTAVALHSLFRFDSMLPMVGASGAISGILGCYFLWFPKNHVRVLMVLFVFVQIIRIPARWVLGFYLVVENLLPFFFTSGDGGVAHGAHIGGFIGGLGGAALVNVWSQRRALNLRGFSMKNETASAGDSASQVSGPERFISAITQDNYALAFNIYAEMPTRQSLRLPGKEVLKLADWLVETGELNAGLAILQRFIGAQPKSPGLPLAYLRAGMIHLQQNRLPAAYQNFLAVLDLPASDIETEGARAGLREIERRESENRRFRLH